jgi:hypothetical protein
VGSAATGAITINLSTAGIDVPSLPERKFNEGAVTAINMTIGDWYIEKVFNWGQITIIANIGEYCDLTPVLCCAPGSLNLRWT